MISGIVFETIVHAIAQGGIFITNNGSFRYGNGYVRISDDANFLEVWMINGVIQFELSNLNIDEVISKIVHAVPKRKKPLW